MLLEKRFIMCVNDKKRFTRAFWKDIIFPNLRCKHSWTFFILPIDLMIWFKTFTLIHSPYHFLMSDCMSRRSPPELFLEKGVLKICRKFTWEHPCRSMISIKLLCNFSETILWHGELPILLKFWWSTNSLIYCNALIINFKAHNKLNNF